VKVQPPNRSILTTQLYFPGEPRNATDNVYSSELLMAVTTGNGEQRAEFNFVLQV
jgi:protocatechuate 3,4-dioxygenase beta subunit